MSNKAHAPYNFVPLNDEHMLEGELFPHTCYAEGRHTGYFDVEMTTVTPLFVRGMRGADMPNDTKISEPFMLNDKPVIPGSSLRGMIRAIVEIITFGKTHFVDDRSLIYRSVGDKTNFGAYYRGHMTDELDDSTR
ncbi:MAG: TIGR03986 family CRISPR-associated RAMP protein, partial [Anaerolineae bacterium]|nr:TIGR03986 family CRISPR-associated RAMP protein [Anaerolineae bacterium]